MKHFVYIFVIISNVMVKVSFKFCCLRNRMTKKNNSCLSRVNYFIILIISKEQIICKQINK